MIAHLTVTDPATFAKYPPLATPMVLAHGGKVLMVTGPGMKEMNVREGTPQHQVTAALEFPSAAAFQGWYTSPEYQAVIGLRTSSSHGWLFGAEGFTPPT